MVLSWRAGKVVLRFRGGGDLHHDAIARRPARPPGQLVRFQPRGRRHDYLRPGDRSTNSLESHTQAEAELPGRSQGIISLCLENPAEVRAVDISIRKGEVRRVGHVERLHPELHLEQL